MYSKYQCLPVGLQSIKSNKYLSYLLNYRVNKTNKLLTDLERYLISMLFPCWDFLVCADNDEYLHMILLPKTERDLFLLNTDLTAFMHELIAHYSIVHIDKGIPIYDDCRYVMENLIDDVENSIGTEPLISISTVEKTHMKSNEESTSSYNITSLIREFRID